MLLLLICRILTNQVLRHQVLLMRRIYSSLKLILHLLLSRRLLLNVLRLQVYLCLLLKLLAIMTRFFLCILLLSYLICHLMLLSILRLNIWVFFLILYVLYLWLSLKFTHSNILILLRTLFVPLLSINSLLFSLFSIDDSLINTDRSQDPSIWIDIEILIIESI